MFSLDVNRLTGLDCDMDECGCTVGSVNRQFGGGESAFWFILPFYLVFYVPVVVWFMQITVCNCMAHFYTWLFSTSFHPRGLCYTYL
jgi:hypothetical protein